MENSEIINKRPCVVDGCDRSRYTRTHRNGKYCSLHYGRIKRNVPFSLPIRANGSHNDKEKLKGILMSKRLINGDCWDFNGYISKQGYGRMWALGKLFKVNRLSAVLWLEFDDGELYVLHTCHNRKCFNPKHLYIGDQKQNMKDRKEAGREAKQLGSSNPSSKLTNQNVIDIRGSSLSMKDLAIKYKVSYGHISKIRRGIVWNHLI